MVIGAKSSPLQLILSSIYHIDNPTGNISYKEVKITKNSMDDLTIPLSYGDSYNGFRIVGTTQSILIFTTKIYLKVFYGIKSKGYS